MPAPSSLSLYGPEYAQLLLCASDAPADCPFKVSLDTPQKALALRRHLYGYFKALRAEGDAAMIARANALTLTVSGAILTLSKRSETWESKAIAASVESAIGAPPPPPEIVAQQQHLARLHEVRLAKATENTPKPKK